MKCYGQSLRNTAQSCTPTLHKQRAGPVYTRKCSDNSETAAIVGLTQKQNSRTVPFSFFVCCCKPFAIGNLLHNMVKAAFP